MSWRRRLLGTTALIGLSVLCLRPVLTTGIERRLSEQLRLPVSVGDTQLAMSQNSLQILDFQIDDEICPMSIRELSLKLDGNGLLYRDCVIESFIGNGLKWYLPKATESVHTASIPSVTTQDNSAVKDIHGIFSQALRSIKDAEILSLDRSREIDLKMESIKNKIDEVLHQSPAPNPLRNSHAVDKLRSDLIAIQALLASDRVESTKVGTSMTRSFEQLNSVLESAQKNPPKATNTTDEIRNVIRENALRLVAERVQPFAVAAEASYRRFLKQLLIDSHAESVGPKTPILIHAGRELVTERIRQREFALKRGKVTGLTAISENNLTTEILISSIRLKHHDANVLQISWTPQNDDGPKTICKIGPSIGSDNKISHLLSLNQKEDNFEVAVKVDYKTSGRDLLISFPLCHVLDDKLGLDPDFIVVFKDICETLRLNLTANSQSSLEAPVIAVSNAWIVDDEANAKIQSALDEAMEQYLDARRESWLQHMQSEHATSKHLLESRKLAIEEERNFRHSTWSDTLKMME
ncbi:MAG: hypothetical protein ACK5N9_18525, partial [Pirellula sp.]